MEKRFALLLLVLSVTVFGCSHTLKTPLNAATPAPSSSFSTLESVPPSSSSSALESAASEPSEHPPLPEEDWQLMLINPDHLLPDDFSITLKMTSYGYEVDERIVEPLTHMINAAASEGVTLLPCYGYRTVEQSAQLFEKQVNRQLAAGLSREAAIAEAMHWVAPPKTSDHHTGLALDIVTPAHQVLNHAFASTPAALWMAAHSTEYGFIIRFPEDKQEITGITYEPWHLRYVGVEHAKKMTTQNLCLEEYWEQLYGGNAG